MGSFLWALADCLPPPQAGGRKSWTRLSQPRVLRAGSEGMARCGVGLRALSRESRGPGFGAPLAT